MGPDTEHDEAGGTEDAPTSTDEGTGDSADSDTPEDEA